jgi:hypothetical protein
MNKRIRKKKIKLMIYERNIPMMKVYPPLEQFLDLQSTKELFTSWGKPQLVSILNDSGIIESIGIIIHIPMQNQHTNFSKRKGVIGK